MLKGFRNRREKKHSLTKTDDDHAGTSTQPAEVLAYSFTTVRLRLLHLGDIVGRDACARHSAGLRILSKVLVLDLLVRKADTLTRNTLRSPADAVGSDEAARHGYL